MSNPTSQHTTTRKLAAILFSDIVGYSALMGKDSGKALELVRVSKDIQKLLVEQHHALTGLGRVALERVRYGQGRNWLDTAFNCANRVLQVDPNNAEANLIMGRYYWDNSDLQKAKNLLLKVLESDPNNSAAMSALSAVHNAMGENEERLRWSYKAQRLDPNNPTRGLEDLSALGWDLMIVGLDSLGEQVIKKHLSQIRRNTGSTIDFSGYTQSEVM